MPTFKELGYDLVASTWFSFLRAEGAAEGDRAAIEPGNRSASWSCPRCKKRVIQDAFDPKPLTPEQLAAFMEAETARWTPIAQARNEEAVAIQGSS